MRRRSSSHTPLRGSVTQSTMRVRSRERSLYGTLLRLGVALVVLLVVAGVVGWLWHVGWPQREAGRVEDAGLHLTQKAQFAVKDIVVEGRQQTAKDAVFAALGTSAGAPILSFDPAAAQARIAKLPWVASAVVERRLPDTILVQLNERVPLARWQHDNHTVVIDAHGAPLPDANLDQFAALPLLVGAGAPDEAAHLLETLKDFPSVRSVMTAAVRVSERRWDLHLQPNIIARLPETDIDDALSRLSQLITGQKILERDIAAIDLRLPDRLIIEPSTPGARRAGDAKL